MLIDQLSSIGLQKRDRNQKLVLIGGPWLGEKGWAIKATAATKRHAKKVARRSGLKNLGWENSGRLFGELCKYNAPKKWIWGSEGAIIQGCKKLQQEKHDDGL